jgi:hypothetical protein
VRILIVSAFFPPLNSIASLRPYSWAKYWTLAGHEVTVLTTKKESNAETAFNLPNPGFQVIEVDPFKGFSFLKRIYQENHIPNTPNQTKSLLSQLKNCGKKGAIKLFDFLRDKKGIFNACRMPDFSDFWIRPAFQAIKNKGVWDIVISSSGPYSVHMVAHKLKKQQLAKKWIADYRDKWSDNHIYKGLFPFNIIERILEKQLLKRADIMTTISAPFAAEYTLKYQGKAIYVVENGFDPSDLEHLDPHPAFPNDGKYRILYTGSLYPGKQNPVPLFKALSEMNEDLILNRFLDKLEILFVGPKQSEIKKLVSQYNVGKWVKVNGFVPREKALQMQRDAHALLFLPWNDVSVDGVLTGKLFEYLYSKTFILAVGANGLEASQKIILDAKAGIILSDESEIQNFLISKLTDISKEQNLLDEKVLRLYNRQLLARHLLELCQGINPCSL